MRFTWPGNAKCAVVLTIEYDAESVEMGFKNNLLGTAGIGGFSYRFGVPRILNLLNKYNIKSTFFVPAWDAERNPDIVKGIAEEGHEIAAHGYLHEDFSMLEPEDEKKVFEKAHKILTNIVGTPPRGFRSGAYARPISPNTLRFVRDLGYIYDSSFLDDDLPYQVKIDDKMVDMIEIPWVWVLNDIVFMSGTYSSGLGLPLPPRSPRWVLDLWKDEFDSLYEEVGFFNLVVHPTHMGKGSRMPIIESLIHFIKGYDGVWFATCSEVADWCLKQLKK
jgi:peptidoglycan/xylan/chitin deacetylase (PgdA/CDA1 family)